METGGSTASTSCASVMPFSGDASASIEKPSYATTTRQSQKQSQRHHAQSRHDDVGEVATYPSTSHVPRDDGSVPPLTTRDAFCTCTHTHAHTKADTDTDTGAGAEQRDAHTQCTRQNDIATRRLYRGKDWLGAVEHAARDDAVPCQQPRIRINTRVTTPRRGARSSCFAI
jgi:hypothetical protein